VVNITLPDYPAFFHPSFLARVLDVLTNIFSINDEQARLGLIELLAPNLSGSLLEQTLARFNNVTADCFVFRILTVLAAQIAKPEREHLIARLWTEALTLDSEHYSGVMKSLALSLNDEQLRQALNSQFAIYALPSIVPRLNGQMRDQALIRWLNWIVTIEHDNKRGWALIKIAPFLNHVLLRRAVESIFSVSEERLRLKAISALPLNLLVKLPDTFNLIPEIMKDSLTAKLLYTLAFDQSSEARESHMVQLFETMLVTEEEWVRADELSVLIPHAKPELIGRILNAACAITDSGSRETVLHALALRLSDDQLPQALNCATAISTQMYRGCALAALAVRLNRDDLLDEYLDAALQYPRQK